MQKNSHPVADFMSEFSAEWPYAIENHVAYIRHMNDLFESTRDMKLFFFDADSLNYIFDRIINMENHKYEVIGQGVDPHTTIDATLYLSIRKVYHNQPEYTIHKLA